MRRTTSLFRPVMLLVAVGCLASFASAVLAPVAAQGSASAIARGDWPGYGLDSGETRFSPLTQINLTNASRLGPAWTTIIGEGGSPQEATPIVSDGVMFLVTSWSVAVALDASTGREIWRWDPGVDRTINASGTSRLCCGIENRGLAIAAGKVFLPTLDGRLLALDAKTGKPVWTAQATPKGDIAYSLTIAPRVAKNKVIIGNSGAEFPPYRGFVSAFDIASGKEAWRFYTVPGDPSKPFENKALEVAAKTWSGEWWKYGGGGSVWDGISYDPEADLVYVATGNGTPWPLVVREQNAGMDNLYVASILALDPDDGRLRWHFQSVPGEQWDYDAVQQMTLASLRIGGRERKVLMQAQKNGFFYVLDRLTGEFISGEPFTRVSWATGLDAKTGRPQINPAARYTTTPVTVAPATGGGHNWAPMAFSPVTGLVYFPASLGTAFTFTATDRFQFTPGVSNRGLNTGRLNIPPALPLEPGAPVSAPRVVPAAIGPEGQGPYLVAWDPIAQKERWRRPGGGAGGGGVVATAGGLVFQMRSDGRFVIYSADSGDLKFEQQIGGGLRDTSPPITYATGGKQYVAVVTTGPPRVQTFVVNAEAPAAQTASTRPDPRAE